MQSLINKTFGRCSNDYDDKCFENKIQAPHLKVSPLIYTEAPITLVSACSQNLLYSLLISTIF